MEDIKVGVKNMKITKQDIKTLQKIKKICGNMQCEECMFNIKNKECILQNQPNWWHLELVKGEIENGKVKF